MVFIWRVHLQVPCAYETPNAFDRLKFSCLGPGKTPNIVASLSWIDVTFVPPCIYGTNFGIMFDRWVNSHAWWPVLFLNSTMTRTRSDDSSAVLGNHTVISRRYFSWPATGRARRRERCAPSHCANLICVVQNISDNPRGEGRDRARAQMGN